MLLHRLEMASLATLSLLLGMLFFILLRPQGIGLDFYFPDLPEPRVWMSPIVLDSFPSFIHMLAHTFACYAFLAPGRLLYLYTSLLLLATTIACEFLTGIFDPLDIAAAIAGTVLAMIIIELRTNPFCANLIPKICSTHATT